MTDYKHILLATATKIRELERERDYVDVEIAKQKQFFYATLNMLPEEESTFGKEIQELLTSQDEGLKEAIRRVLMAADGWLTVAMVRDRLVKTGFDITKYSGAPLASIGTTLKRMPESEVERSELDGVAAYRWIKTTNQFSFWDYLLQSYATDVSAETQQMTPRTRNPEKDAGSRMLDIVRARKKK